MPDDVGHFKVVLEAEVDRDVGKTLEKGFEKSSEKIGKKLQEEIEESIDKSVKKARKFEKSFKIPSFGQIGEKLTGFLGESTKKITVGGLATIAGEGGGSGIMAIVGKLSIVVGILALVYDVIKSLAPVVAIFKLISAMLQLTLYPIAQFLLTIFKPILAIILKMFIIPWYTVWGPALARFFTALKEGDINLVGKLIWQILAELAIAFGLSDPIIKGMIINTRLFLQNLKTLGDFISGILNFIINGAITNLQLFIQNLKNLANFILTGVIVNIQLFLSNLNDLKSWLFSSWSNVTEIITKPLRDFLTWIDKNFRLPTWAGGTPWSGDYYSDSGWSGNDWSNWLNYDDWSGNTWSGNTWSGNTLSMARGGIVREPTVSLIGEAGPEAVIPLPGFLSKEGGVLGSLGKAINITFNIAKVEKSVDIEEIINKIERTLYTNMKRAGAR